MLNSLTAECRITLNALIPSVTETTTDPDENTSEKDGNTAKRHILLLALVGVRFFHFPVTAFHRIFLSQPKNINVNPVPASGSGRTHR
jgi:hypothetical protein